MTTHITTDKQEDGSMFHSALHSNVSPQRCQIRAAGARVGVGVLLLAVSIVLCGCASKNSQPSPSHKSEGQEADDAAFAAAASRPPTPNTLFALSNILATQGRDQECEYVLKRILQQDPQYLPAYSDLGELYLRANRIDDAADVLAKGLEQAPADPVLLNNYGMCQFLSGNYAEALESFEAAARAAPKDRTARANQAAALGMMGREDEARKIYQQFMNRGDVRHNMMVLRNAQKRRAENLRDPMPPPLEEAAVDGAPPTADDAP